MEFFELVQRELQSITEEFAAALPNIALGLAVLVIGLIVTRLIRRAIIIAIKDTPAGLVVERALARVATIIGVFISIILALATMGVDVGGLVAGLGLTGLALGLALKDTLENAITGVLLLIQRPFNIGDVVDVAGHVGTIADIAIRTTHIKRFDGIDVIIPNSKVFNGVVVNWTRYPVRRMSFTVSVAFDDDLDLQKALHVVSEAVVNTEGVLDDPVPTTHFDALDGSAINIVVRFWAAHAGRSGLDIKSDVVKNITEAARRESIDIPFPIRKVYLNNVEPA